MSAKLEVLSQKLMQHLGDRIELRTVALGEVTIDVDASNYLEVMKTLRDDQDFRFELKAQEVAVSLASAVVDSGITQKALADKLGWKTSRVSKVLHGGSNLTLKTLFDVCEALNIEFDICEKLWINFLLKFFDLFVCFYEM